MDLKKEIKKIGVAAKLASRKLAWMNTGRKNTILRSAAKALLVSQSSILKANKKDIKAAKAGKLSPALIDRLKLTEERIKAMADSMSAIARLDDPVGVIEKMVKRPNGLLIGKMKVPIGVIGVIYESRPNVTADCIGLCLKSGNGLILRGGKEAINSNIAIFDVINKAALASALPKNAINLIKTTERSAVESMLTLKDEIDLIIPRGGESLITEVTKKSLIPVIKHYKGVCHVYVDEEAELNMAEHVVHNAKVQRPGVCNAMETLLVHKDVAARFLPSMAKKFKAAGVEMRGCALTRRILKDFDVKKAEESDWYEEYLDLVISIKVVKDFDEAINHIAKYGTSHSEAIITENYKRAMQFLERVDSSAVYVNASTRFTDGKEFGKGAEIGISTDKLHARGPMGLEELTTYKYVIFGDGHVRT